MHVGEILTADCANGEGVRLSVFVSGCTNHCEGCFQPQTWDFSYGRQYNQEMENWIINEVSKSYYHGLTLLGGEPFEPSNQETEVGLIRRMKKDCPQKNIWIYTGFVYDRDLVPGGCRYTKDTDEILDSIDYLVDGRFIEAEKDITLKFRGSRNQRIIDVKETRQQGKIVLSPLNN